MTRGSFENEIWINAPRVNVMELLSSFSQHTRLHPLIVRVAELPAAPPVLKRYQITDQLALGPFKFQINYRADIFKITLEEVYTEAFQSPGVQVINHSFLTPVEQGTQVREEVTIVAPALLFGYTFQQAQAAHKTLLAQLKEVLEQTA